MMPKTIHTMARAYQDICAGEDPWTALGNFANAWYDYAKDARAALVSEPLGKPVKTRSIRAIGQPFAQPQLSSCATVIGSLARHG